MKRNISLLLALVMILALAGCGRQEAGPLVDTCILKEADEAMINNYSLLAVNPAAPFTDADVKAAFAAIAEGGYPFISRGDGSGTHTKELSLWPEALGITAEAESFRDYSDWYISANTGMGACLVMAEEKGAYILTDKANFLTFAANGGTVA